MITRINPPELGSPPGYSQIVEVTAGRIIFIAGQTALDRDGNVVGRTISLSRPSRCSKTLRSRCRPSDARPPTW
jgi:hypothetical protein